MYVFRMFKTLTFRNILLIDGVNETVLRIMLLKNGKEVSSLSWINVLSFIHKILIFYLLNPNRHLGI